MLNSEQMDQNIGMRHTHDKEGVDPIEVVYENEKSPNIFFLRRNLHILSTNRLWCLGNI